MINLRNLNSSLLHFLKMGQEQNKDYKIIPKLKNICTFSLDEIEYSFEVNSDNKTDLIKLLKDLYILNPDTIYIEMIDGLLKI